MYDFTGCECPVCHQRFHPDDDLVVCPDCGAPYHRACYEKAGKCVFHARHGAGFAWEPADAPAAQEKVCAVCGVANPADNRYCKNCGSPLNEEKSRTASSGRAVSDTAAKAPQSGFDYSRLYGNTYTPPMASPFANDDFMPAVDPNETLDGIPAAEWAAYIGPSSRVYLLVFKQMELLRRKISFSFSAMLFGPFYFFYRKAWKPALIFTGLMMLVNVPSLLYFLQLTGSTFTAGMSTRVLSGLISAAAVLDFAITVFRGLYGFYFYKKSAEAHIRQIQKSCSDAQKRSYILSAQGGTSFAAVLLAFFVIMILFYLVLLPFLGPNVNMSVLYNAVSSS